MVARIGISPGVAHPNIISFIGQDVRQGLKKSTRWYYNMMITACRITWGHSYTTLAVDWVGSENGNFGYYQYIHHAYIVGGRVRKGPKTCLRNI